MDSVKKKLDAIRTNIVGKTEKFSYELFLKVVHELEPDLQFDDDKKLELFENLSEGNDGFVPRREIENLLQMIEKRERRISADYINEFSLDKLSELKQIYQACDRKGAGTIKISQVENFLSQLYNSAGSKEEILYFFRAVAEISTESVNMKLFSKVLSELEKRLYDQLTYMGPIDDTSIDVEEADEQMRLDASEINRESLTGMNLEEDSEAQTESITSIMRESLIDEFNLSQLYSKIQAINEKIEQIISLNIKDAEVKKPLFTAHDQLQSLKLTLKQTETKFETMENEIEVLKSNLELQKARMESLEFDVKREYENQEKILQIADNLKEENIALRKEIHGLEVFSRQIQEKNQQIVLLESQCNSYIQENKRTEQKLQETLREKEVVIKNIENLEHLVQINLKDDIEKGNIQAENEKNEGASDVSPVKNEIRELKKQLEVLRWEKDSRGAELENANLKVDALNTRITELIEENRDKDGIIQTLKLELAKLNIQSNEADLSRSQIHPFKNQMSTLDREIGFLHSHDATNLKEEALHEPTHEDIKKQHTANFLNENLFKADIISNKTPTSQNRLEEEAKSLEKFEEVRMNGLSQVLDTSLRQTEKDSHEFEMNIETKIFDPMLPQDSSFKKQFGNRSSAPIRLSQRNLLSRLVAPSQKAQIDKIKGKDVRNKKLIETAYLWSMNKSINLAKSIGPGSEQKLLRTMKMTATLVYQEGMFARDYLSLRTNTQIIRLLSQYNDKAEICYSDYVVRISSSEKKEKRIIFVTESALYTLHPTKKYELVRRIELKKIGKLTLPETSAVHLVIHVKNEYDYLFEVYRRANLVLFLMETFRKQKIPDFALNYETRSLFIQNRKATMTKKLNQYDKATIQPEMQEAYRNAAKLGFLYLNTNSWFFAWKQYFFVMIDIGIMYFSGPGV